MTKFYIDTLGCAKNEYDSAMLSAKLCDAGLIPVSHPEEADYIIVNTCGFIDDAKKESIEHIFQMADIKKDNKLIVTGCLSQRYHDELIKEMPEVDMFFGVNDYDVIPDIIVKQSLSKDYIENRIDSLPYRKRMFKKDAYSDVLKIAEGCNNACSFCAIPSIRGKYRSKKMEDCIAEAKDMAEAGIKELILIAQDTSQYGKDLYGSVKLTELLNELCKIDGIEWIRLQYVYDNGITDELIETIKNQPKICNYLDIPIQHISDNVLNRMRRKSTSDSIKNTIDKLRKEIPDIHIRTTLLVGFPGENEQDFQELLDFIDSTDIDRLGAFAFSDEEGTTSYKLNNKIPDDVKEERRNLVMEHQLLVSQRLNERKIGKIFDVIIDEVEDNDLYIGRTRYDSPDIDCEVTVVSTKKHMPGDIIKVCITDAFEYDLEGEEVL